MFDCFGEKVENPENKNDTSETDSTVFDTQRIFFDEYGNLVYNQNMEIPNREAELRKVLELDPGVDTADGLKWYLMDAPWLESWVYWAVKDKEKVAPRPGPCYNQRLIFWHDPTEIKIAKVEDDESHHIEPKPTLNPVANALAESKGDIVEPVIDQPRWMCREVLAMATEARAGDYRRVTEDTWLAFKELYPKSGPAITMIYVKDKKYAENGYYPTTHFEILDPPVNPNLPKEEKGWFGFSRSASTTNNNNKSSKENQENNSSSSSGSSSSRYVVAGGSASLVATVAAESQTPSSGSNSTLLQSKNANVLTDTASSPLWYSYDQSSSQPQPPAVDLTSHAEIEAMRSSILAGGGHDSDDDKDSDDD